MYENGKRFREQICADRQVREWANKYVQMDKESGNRHISEFEWTENQGIHVEGQRIKEKLNKCMQMDKELGNRQISVCRRTKDREQEQKYVRTDKQSRNEQMYIRH